MHLKYGTYTRNRATYRQSIIGIFYPSYDREVNIIL